MDNASSDNECDPEIVSEVREELHSRSEVVEVKFEEITEQHVRVKTEEQRSSGTQWRSYSVKRTDEITSDGTRLHWNFLGDSEQ